MTSDEVETLVRRYYEAVDGGDVPAVLECFADDAVYRRPGYAPLRGREALERFYREERVIADGEHTLDAVVVQGRGAAVRGTFAGSLRDGRHVEIGFADFFIIDEHGRVAERHTYFERPGV